MQPAICTQLSRDLIPRQRAAVVKMAAGAVRLDARCIGWLPWQFYEHHDEHGRLVAVFRDGEMVGFAAFGAPDFGQRSRVFQVWVQKDARQIEHGRALMNRVARTAADEGAAWLTCWVAEDLEAMRFWPAIGFHAIARKLGRGDITEFASLRFLTNFARRTQCPLQLTTAPPSS